MKSSPAGRAGIQAVSLFGPKFGTAAVGPAACAASASHNAAELQTKPAKIARAIVRFRELSIDADLDMEHFLVRQPA
jgi:hypothetical protein